MSFKVKSRKKILSDARVTLDAKHTEKIDYFNSLKNSVPEKEKKLRNLNQQLNRLEKIDKKKLLDEDFDKIMDLKDEIKTLQEDINGVKNSKEDINYLLNTGHLLFNYYNNINDVAEGKVGAVNDLKNNSNSSNVNSKSVMDYFNCGAKPAETENNSNYMSKAKIYEKYLSKTNDNFVMSTEDYNVDICPKCNVERIMYLSEGKQVCPCCSEETFILVDSDKPSYKDPPREVCYFAYKRINHFNEWLAQFQAKESTDIPADVYEKILEELKKERISNMCELTPIKLREILKKLKKNKYYEHVPHIINKLNGQPPPIMTRETEEELRRMFKEIQIPFHKHCPKARKNFLSYSYVLHKFVQLLELDEFLPCFMLLKSREKLHQQDQIWKKICEELNWEFIPSV